VLQFRLPAVAFIISRTILPVEPVMLLIVNLAAKGENLPIETLEKVDSTLVSCGFRKEVRSATKPGKQYSITYDGPSTEKSQIEEMLRPLSDQGMFTFSVEVEESVKFP
jgi:hypothetical protein